MIETIYLTSDKLVANVIIVLLICINFLPVFDWQATPGPKGLHYPRCETGKEEIWKYKCFILIIALNLVKSMEKPTTLRDL